MTENSDAKEEFSSRTEKPAMSWLRSLKSFVVRYKPRVQRLGTFMATIAALGAVLGGLTGYWSAYKTVTYDLLGIQKPVSPHVEPDPKVQRNSIAVLPFAVLGDPAHEYLGAAISNSLTNDLSFRVPGLFIVGVDSALSYAKRSAGPPQLGRELGVQYLLLGAVQRSSGRIRVDARLVESQSSKQLWAEKFEGADDDLFQLQDFISSRIANSFGVALLRQSTIDAERRRATPEITDLILRAQAEFLLNNRSLVSLAAAESLYRQALELEQNNSDALIGLGNLLAVRLSLYRFSLKMTPDQLAAAVADARNFLDRGLILNPRSAIAHNGKGRLYAVEGKPIESLREHEMARSVDPNYAVNYHNLGAVELSLGKPQKALEYLEEAILRSPRDPAIGIIQMHMARAYVLLGRWDDAIEAATKAMVSPTDMATVQLNLAAAYAEKGQLDSARSALLQTKELRPGISISALRAANEPAYTELAQKTLFEGLRKAGLTED
ncbi:tetratricopeptide repeat protein [Bradyrhizobium betae]|uniref:Tetratricopeptide repeat protein n=2 Tax=Bradyrhizobium betae TaxID=244734 RepID=A0A5P6P1C7_9BRAD|nr:tetratricopeptide repeat protein [Bradyrhizobium betae]